MSQLCSWVNSSGIIKNEDENIAINMWSTVGFKTEFGIKIVETLRIALYNCDLHSIQVYIVNQFVNEILICVQYYNWFLFSSAKLDI